jgi:photosystem II stability/assembly factor-like uncharacterized protein
MVRSSHSVRRLLVAVLLSALAAGCSRSQWHAVHLQTDASWNGIWFADSLNGWISGGSREVAGGLLGRTRDGGRTWTIRSHVVDGTPAGFSVWQIQFRDTLNGCMVSDGGLVLLTDDGGSTWRTAYSMGYGTLMRVQLLGERDGWALGPAATIGSNDGGETWHQLAHNRSESEYLTGRAVAFADPLHGWLVSHHNELMRTENGGRDWTPVPLPLPKDTPVDLSDVTFVDAMNGWVVGGPGLICRTRDGGATWELQVNGVPVKRAIRWGEKPPPNLSGEWQPPSKLMLMAVRFADAHRGFAVGFYADAGESVILGTRDGGARWTVEKTVPGQLLLSLFVLDRRHAWATGTRVRGVAAQPLYRYTVAD